MLNTLSLGALRDQNQKEYDSQKLAYYVQHHVPPFGLDVPDVS